MTYDALGRSEALGLRQDVFLGNLRLLGKENRETLREGNNYAASLAEQKRYGEVKSLMRKTLPVARRVLGENDETTLKARLVYAIALCKDTGATLDDLREGVTTLEEIERIARQVFGGANPLVTQIAQNLGCARALLGARDGTVAVDALREAVTTLEEEEVIARLVFGGEHPLTTGIEHDLRNARAALRARETPSPG